MRGYLLICLACVGFWVAIPAQAQSIKMKAQDCMGSMRGDTCEMTPDQYDIYTRSREWNANVKRNEEFDALHHQLSAEAKARYNQHTRTGASEVMRRRRAAAAAGQN